ncbi:MAG: hypothetical protein DRG76_03685 [Deltaproteobacteria bacterium]|nr:MAG: hypothetical protein DRG76_03685 [Deltaproteobacteria bacterium]
MLGAEQICQSHKTPKLNEVKDQRIAPKCQMSKHQYQIALRRESTYPIVFFGPFCSFDIWILAFDIDDRVVNTGLCEIRFRNGVRLVFI